MSVFLMHSGYISEIDGFAVFIDTAAYDAAIIASLASGDYEHQDRKVAKAILCTGDRVIECGTAIGSVTMSAAKIVGEGNIVSFEANPIILADAKANFERNGLTIDARHGILCNRTTYAAKTVTFGISSYFLASRLDLIDGTDIVDRIDVPTFSLEDEIRSLRANVLLIDIEGGEVDLLSGADLTGIEKIAVELHHNFVGEERTNLMLRFLMAEGFNFDQLTGYQLAVLRR